MKSNWPIDPEIRLPNNYKKKAQDLCLTCPALKGLGVAPYSRTTNAEAYA